MHSGAETGCIAARVAPCELAATLAWLARRRR